jgi:hypothetical protein
VLKSITEMLQYDQKNDILYYTRSDEGDSYGDENPDNIVIMRDIESDVVTGITVLNFARMYRTKDARLKILEGFFRLDDVTKMYKIK